ncbi:MAG: 8-oxoguanine DNA glycosylase [Clostridia bacterium]|nr:8-oxoguanine DNA glycosylase [Clostridia bacterium]
MDFLTSICMNYSIDGGIFRFNANKNIFSPAKTFDCGQCFRWNPAEDGGFKGIVAGRALKLCAEPSASNSDVLAVYDMSGRRIDEAFGDHLAGYFDFGFDYAEAFELLSSKDDIMEKAAEASRGIHILKQDFFETVISFIISANNNIPRIKKCIERISELYGKAIYDAAGDIVGYAFPEASALSAVEPSELCEKARVGYRAEYIVRTSVLFAENRVSYSKLCGEDSRAMQDEIVKLPGVGPKVANCIMLFSGLCRGAFPVDVWVERLMQDFYGLEGMSRQALEKYGKDYFGEYAGLAQQFLFYYKRLIS